MNNMNLSKNFTLDELTETTTGLPNVPFQDEIDNLKLLTTKVLQPARDYMGIPISISSGYRSPLVNRKAKGSPTSHHVLGMDGYSLHNCMRFDSVYFIKN